MTRIIALTALTTLGLSDAPVHEPSTPEATTSLILLLCVTSPRAPGSPGPAVTSFVGRRRPRRHRRDRPAATPPAVPDLVAGADRLNPAAIPANPQTPHQGPVILCWLALLLIRARRTTTGVTWATIADKLDLLTLGTFTGLAGTIWGGVAGLGVVRTAGRWRLPGTACLVIAVGRMSRAARAGSLARAATTAHPAGGRRRCR